MLRLRNLIYGALLVALFGLGPTRAYASTPAPTTLTFPLASEWDWEWDGFRKYWRNQLGKTTGIVGTVTIVIAIGALIVMSAKKKT